MPTQMGPGRLLTSSKDTSAEAEYKAKARTTNLNIVGIVQLSRRGASRLYSRGRGTNQAIDNIKRKIWMHSDSRKSRLDRSDYT